MRYSSPEPTFDSVPLPVTVPPKSRFELDCPTPIAVEPTSVIGPSHSWLKPAEPVRKAPVPLIPVPLSCSGSLEMTGPPLSSNAAPVATTVPLDAAPSEPED